MEPLWQNGRLTKVENWFQRIKARPAFESAFLKWMPAELTEEMYCNGQQTWPEIEKLISL